jgi:hypothetical protein
MKQIRLIAPLLVLATAGLAGAQEVVQPETTSVAVAAQETPVQAARPAPGSR